MANRKVTKDVSDNIIAGAAMASSAMMSGAARLIEAHASDAKKVTVNKGGYEMPIQIGNFWFLCDTATHVDSATDIDTGAVAASTAYYVYAVTDESTLSFKTSLSATNPTGYDTAHSKVLGGFTTDGSKDITAATIWDVKLRDVTGGFGRSIDGAQIKGGTNTFSITSGTASMDVAAGATVNVDANLTVSGATTLNGAASTTVAGPIEIATNVEALAGTDTARAITPDDLKYVLDRRIQQFYGVSWDESADTYVRTGSTAGQTCGVALADAFLPVHRRMRGCVVADDGTVAYYLCATDWTKKEDGATASDLTGTDGQVMVEIPKFWYRYGYLITTHTWEVSPVPLTGFKVHEAFMSDNVEKDYLYIGAYEACLYDVSASKYVGQAHQTSVSAVFATSDDSITIATRTGWATALAVGQKLVITGTSNNNTTVTVKTIESATKITVDENLTDETAATTVIQTQTDVTDTTGDKLCSVSGVCPITGGSANGAIAHFRTWAENRGGGKAANDAASFQWSQEFGDALAALQLLYLTEYASFYSQSVLGYGIAAVEDWAAYNDYNPIAKSGNGNAVGNASGNTATSLITTGAGATSVYLKYRGIENLYGHIWKFIDGYKVNNNIPYLCNNFANFSDAENTTNYTNPTDVNGAAITMHNGNGYQGTLELTGRGFFPASLTGGSASAKITDYYYQESGWCVVDSGGKDAYAAGVGAFCLDNVVALAYVNRNIGGRLVGRK
ncbi:MAG: hypothetical protein WC455_16500 [Dehalococcoidia bacterium]